MDNIKLVLLFYFKFGLVLIFIIIKTTEHFLFRINFLFFLDKYIGEFSCLLHCWHNYSLRGKKNCILLFYIYIINQYLNKLKIICFIVFEL